MHLQWMLLGCVCWPGIAHYNFRTLLLIFVSAGRYFCLTHSPLWNAQEHPTISDVFLWHHTHWPNIEQILKRHLYHWWGYTDVSQWLFVLFLHCDQCTDCGHDSHTYFWDGYFTFRSFLLFSAGIYNDIIIYFLLCTNGMLLKVCSLVMCACVSSCTKGIVALLYYIT